MEEKLLREIIEKLDMIITILNNGVPDRGYTIQVNPDIYYPRNDDPPQTWTGTWPQPEPSTIR